MSEQHFYSSLLPEWKDSLCGGSCTVSVNMIVKDEAPRMARVLRSLIALNPAEVIVGDTGSSDETKDIASYFGCRVIDVEWNDHFSDARNIVLGHSKSDYVFWIDADEELEEISAQNMKNKIMSGNLNEDYHMVRFSDPPTAMFQNRFWKNRPEAKWSGRIHEKVWVDTGFEKHPDIRIVQHQDERRESKHKRNIRLLEIAMSEDPSNVDNYFHAAILYHMVDDQESSVIYANKYLTASHKEDMKTRVYMLYLLAYIATYNEKNYQKAVNLLASAIVLSPCSAELWCLMGNIYWWIGRKSDAIVFYENAIELGYYEDDILWLVNLDKYDKYPRERIEELSKMGVKKSSPPKVSGLLGFRS